MKLPPLPVGHTHHCFRLLSVPSSQQGICSNLTCMIESTTGNIVHCRREQSRFIGSWSRVGAIIALRLVLEIHHEFNQSLLIFIVDLNAAFDC